MPRRKLATVLSCDVTGSTAMGERLDAESVQDLMLRYFHTMRDALERHGGTVEKFIGDAVVAVFGVPVAHEDDALRACRAAIEMRERLGDLNVELERAFGARLATRIGICTSELVARDSSSRQTFVTGDAANMAARLQQAAAPGEILISAPTYELVAHAVEVESAPPLRAKGKEQRIAAYRLLAAAAVRRPVRQTPFVGRADELETLVGLLDRQRAVVATVIGEPGVGKSRLVTETATQLRERATLLVGHCLSYGEGITYWPVAEIVRTAARIYDEDSPQQARAKLDAVCGRTVGERVAAAIGLPGAAAGREDIAWAFRELFKALAERPLLLVVEDVHWAERALLDLLASLDEIEAPILVVLTARPELLERRPDWPVTLTLAPLAEDDAARLAQHLGGEDERLVRMSGGNPLFLEELYAFVREHPDAQTLPPTLSTLLAARLDRLPEAERLAAERASIEGERFHRGAVTALGADASQLPALAARGVIRPARADFAGEASFRFKHALVRDAAYNGIAKKERVELHERFADWLGRIAADRLAEYEEFLGYHLERAYRLCEELGPVDDHARDVARRASAHLARAGHRAWDLHSDATVPRGLLGRALDLLPWEERAPAVELHYCASIQRSGHDDEAEALMRANAKKAAAAGDRERELITLLMLAYAFNDEDESAMADALALAAEASNVFTASGNRLGLLMAHAATMGVHEMRGECTAAIRAATSAYELAGDIEDPMWMHWFPLRRLIAKIEGATPVNDALEFLELESAQAQSREVHQLPNFQHFLSAWRVLLLTMAGRFEETTELRARIVEIRPRMLPFTRLHSCSSLRRAYMLTGDFAAAEREARELLGLTTNPNLPPTAGSLALAETMYALGYEEEVERWARDAAARTRRTWIQPQARWRRILALALARRGDIAQAERLVREALELLEPTEWLELRADTHLALGEITGDAPHLKRALELYERKGILAMAARARDQLATTAAA
jgi:class 3 adenylate cyclase/tetratricopeptide (TPR) repeat protein